MHVIEAHAPQILRLCQERGNIVLAERGVTTSTGSLSRVPARHRIIRKKRLSTQRSRTGRMSQRPVRRGSRVNATSIPTL
ncbi:hypothetical protein [Methylobacterium segetis]|uniref:hypothetical protein n=1 Tax=Methylobacterium segetis TaxID=2488750 RepID=UPI001051E46A